MTEILIMHNVIICVMLCCWYFLVLHVLAKKSVDKSKLPIIAIILMVIYLSISATFLMIINLMGVTQTAICTLTGITMFAWMIVAIRFAVIYRKEISKTAVALFISNLIVIGVITIFVRQSGFRTDVLVKLDSLQNAVRARSLLPMKHFLLNIILFIPTGFLIPNIYQKKLCNPVVSIIFGLFSSTCIEAIQMIFSMGQCDIEDILANTIGATVGWGMYAIVKLLEVQERIE